jgi:hypothetical protein
VPLPELVASIELLLELFASAALVELISFLLFFVELFFL